MFYNFRCKTLVGLPSNDGERDSNEDEMVPQAVKTPNSSIQRTPFQGHRTSEILIPSLFPWILFSQILCGRGGVGSLHKYVIIIEKLFFPPSPHTFVE